MMCVSLSEIFLGNLLELFNTFLCDLSAFISGGFSDEFLFLSMQKKYLLLVVALLQLLRLYCIVIVIVV